MPRYKLTIEYDGAKFFGWQRQEKTPTVQQCIEDSLFNITHQKVTIFGAGRTDAGVHALGQVAHVDLDNFIEPFRLQDGLNHFLKRVGISVIQVEQTHAEFHARFSAKSRVYEYKILNRRAMSPVLEQRVWHVIKPLDIQLMQDAAYDFIGRHNFQAFRSAECQAKSPTKNLTNFNLRREGDMIFAKIEAPSFLHNQVRIMMGTLAYIGTEKLPVTAVQKALKSFNRSDSGPTASPYGLYLVEVHYEA